MKFSRTAGIAILTVLLSGNVLAQESWQRFRSVDSKVSIELPTSAKGFFDPDGFMVSSGLGINDLLLTDARIIATIFDGASLSIETYTGSSSALDRIYERDKRRSDVHSSGKQKIGGVEVKEISSKGQNFFAVRRYFSVGSSIYIISAAARAESSSAKTRFLNSLRIAGKDADPEIGVSFEDIPRHNPEMEVRPSTGQRGKVDDLKEEIGVSKLVLVHRPFASYTEAARRKRTTGKIVLRATFGVNGLIDKIIVVESLENGLLRQAIFSALRTKFLPKERNGIPEPSTNAIEYTFNIY